MPGNCPQGLKIGDAVDNIVLLAECSDEREWENQFVCAKLEVARQILDQHPGEPALIIGMYVEQIKEIVGKLGVPAITGTTSQKNRDKLFEEFKTGRLRVLDVAEVANFAVDLPDASEAIQISGTFGSRQEEAQRLGRILRPKAGTNQAHFYTLVSRDTVEQEFALRRQLFFCEQGYDAGAAESNPL